MNVHIRLVIWVIACFIVVGVPGGTALSQPASLGGLPATRLPSNSDSPVRLPHDALTATASADATLNEIAIISEDHLCAVGDRGVILTTLDAGRQWKMAPSPTTCNLHAVDFAGSHGIAVGGWIGNVTSTSHGVVLTSEDGGRSWNEQPAFQLARLTGVQITGQRIIAWGDFSPELNASVFESMDGGRSWRGLPLAIGHATVAAATRAGAVAAVDSLGRAAFTQDPSIRTIQAGGSAIRSMLHTGKRWLACGDGGLVISSLDGKDWKPVDLPLSAEARAVVRFDAIETLSAVSDFAHSGSPAETQLWLVGSPGSIVLHSSDGGSTWETGFTGQPLPLRHVSFLDQNRGWAVGAGGVILATRDGGKTWYDQRRSFNRVGLLSVVHHHSLVPWCPLAAAAWDEQVAAVSIITQPEDAIASADFVPHRTAQLECLAPRIGLAEQRTWRRNANRSIDEQARHLAVELLSWRPDVVLTNEQTKSKTFRQNQPSLPISQAIALAADASLALPFIQELGLANWQVGKLSAVTASETGQYSEQSRRVLRAPGLAIWDVLLPLPPDVRKAAESVPMRTLWAQSQATVVHASLMGGCAKSSETSRDLSISEIGNYQLVMGRVHRQKSLDALVDDPYSEADEKWKHDLNFVLNSFPESEAAPAVIDLAMRLAEIGDESRLHGALEILAQRAAGDDAADWAKLTLLRLSSSDEFSAGRHCMPFQLHADRSESSLAPATASPATPHINQAIWNATPFDTKAEEEALSEPLRRQAETPAVVTASATETLESSPEIRRKSHWFQLLDQTFATSPALHARADMQLLLAHNLGAVGNEAGQVQKLQTVEREQLLVGWQLCARQELMLAANQLDKLKWLAFASRTSTPPVLDGILNEPFWQDAPPIVLSDFSETSASRRTQIAWGFDEEYLYVGIECMRDASSQPKPLATKRTYDASLDDLDHVQFVLDTDRDYNTAIEMAVAEDGQTYDRCCGVVSYNPKWHVLVNSEPERWTAEIAIRLADLTTQPTLDGASWAISARRLAPDHEPLSWSQLRTHRPLLQSSGLLLFAPPR